MIMKAGIYFNPQSLQLLYVNPERRVLCYTKDDEVCMMERARSIEFAVRTRNKEKQIELEDGTLCDRVQDVAPGCDPARYLEDVFNEMIVGGVAAIGGVDYAAYVLSVQASMSK
jgi:hypothetical protein